ncbi:MAG: hypothetical protein IT328_04745 [Caldilineaceae bacterium]|nr:hypothetical protein [Caldilineaceae bacterium]
MARDSIYELVDDLPTNNMTTRVMRALDFIAPNEWENLVGFEYTIRAVTGEKSDAMIQKIGERAIALYEDKKQGYQRAMWLYRTVDNIDTTLAKLAIANTVGEQIRWLGFLNRITPKADTLQGLDLSLKLATELAAFCLINGIPGDSISDFVKALGEYGKESLMRMVALVALDGIVPLGPDFIGKIASILDGTDPKELEGNRLYQGIRDYIPGATSREKFNVIQRNFDSTSGWMRDLVSKSGVTREKIVDSLSTFVDVTDRKLDYLAAFMDMTTNYYEHTGTQTLARRLIERAVNEI